MPLLTAHPVYDRVNSMILFPGTVRSRFPLPHGIRTHIPQDVFSKLCLPVSLLKSAVPISLWFQLYAGDMCLNTTIINTAIQRKLSFSK